MVYFRVSINTFQYLKTSNNYKSCSNCSGDYRIPKSMLTNVADGSRIDAKTKYPKKGIYRGSGSECSWNADYFAYVCSGIDYGMLIIESLDEDTETRRLSPVAVATEGYIDLINGPQVCLCNGFINRVVP